MAPDEHAASAYHAAPDRVCCGVCERCERDGVWVLGGICHPCFQRREREKADAAE